MRQIAARSAEPGHQRYNTGSMPTHPVTGLPGSTAINLRRLLWLRLITVSGLLLTLAFVVNRLGLALPVTPLLLVLTAMAGISALTFWRLQLRVAVREPELFMQLLVDVAALTIVFYLSGGSTNPLVMLYLLPLAIAAASLPGGYVWAVAAVTVCCYSLLLGWYMPLATGSHTHDGVFGLHVLGMWLGFMLSAGLIAGFAVRMNSTLRERERALSELREQALRQEQVVALGTLAAGAAHELGTPLSTMAVLIKDIEPGLPVSGDKLDILRRQIVRCKEILGSLSSAAGQMRAEAGRGQALDGFLNDLLDRWSALRPGVTAGVRFDGVHPAPVIIAEQTLAQAITNILNNAADASPDSVDIAAHWVEDELTLEIADRGPGLAPELAAGAGQPFVTTKAEGLGLGLFLAYTTFRRFGGDVALYPRDGGGTLCRLTLPLAALKVNA